MTEHQRKVIETYKSGLTLRETGDEFGISYQRVHFIIMEYDPGALRLPHAGVYPRCRWPRQERSQQNWAHRYKRVNATIGSEVDKVRLVSHG